MNFEKSNIPPSTENEPAPQEVFMRSFTSRINELVEAGRIPAAFAESRRRAAAHIENGLDNPEAQGVFFAEIGLEAVEGFKNAVEEVERLTGEHVSSPFEDLEKLHRQDLIARLDTLKDTISESIDRLEKSL